MTINHNKWIHRTLRIIQFSEEQFMSGTHSRWRELIKFLRFSHWQREELAQTESQRNYVANSKGRTLAYRNQEKDLVSRSFLKISIYSAMRRSVWIIQQVIYVWFNERFSIIIYIQIYDIHIHIQIYSSLSLSLMCALTWALWTFR